MIDTTNRNTALASALVEELARCGVVRAFISPGSRSTPVALALDREPSITSTVILDERVAGFAALGASMASGVPAVIACTSGSAAANLHPAVVEADQAGVPLIVLTSDRPPELRGIGAGQTIDQIALYGSAPRWFCEVGTHDADDTGLMHMRATGCRAFGEAVSGAGPVHLNLSWRDPLGPEPAPEDLTAADPLAIDGRSGERPLTVHIDSNDASEAVLAAISEAVGRSERGLVVVGRLPNRRLSAGISRLAERTGFPILAEPTSQLRYGTHERALVISSYDLICRTAPRELDPDLILRFGDLPTSKPLRSWLSDQAPAQIVIDPPGRWNEPTRKAGAMVRADASSVIAGLLDRLESEPGAWGQRWKEVEARAQAAIDEVLTGSGKLSEPLVHRMLGSAFAGGDRVLLASSMPVRDAEAFLPGGAEPILFHSNRGANGIDGLVSTGAGIAIGSGDPTWIVLGDLALAHDVGGMAAARAIESPLRVVVIDNGGGGIFDFLPQAEQLDPARFGRLFTTPSDLDLERAADAFGLPYAEIGDEAGLRGLVEHPRVLARVRIPREGNVALHRDVAGAVAAAIAA